MTSVDLFDGQSCCGPSSDAEQAARAVARFVADAGWLKARGVAVRRLSLSSDPGEFLRSQAITELLTMGGMGALPALVVDGELKCSGRYPDRAELADWCGLADADAGALGALGALGAPEANPSTDAADGCCTPVPVPVVLSFGGGCCGPSTTSSPRNSDQSVR